MKLKLIDKKFIGKDVVSFILNPEEKLTWLPGQFMHYILNHPKPDDRGIERWFTISSAPYEKHIAISTRIYLEKSSSFKTRLNALSIGGFIEGDGPKGKFIVDNFNEYDVFIAGGIGITPFRSIFLDAAYHNQSLKGALLYANREGQFYFKDELEQAVASQNNLTINYFTDQEINEETVLEVIPNNIHPVFYVSGPEQMVEYYTNMLLRMGFADSQIKKDYFPGYAWKK